MDRRPTAAAALVAAARAHARAKAAHELTAGEREHLPKKDFVRPSAGKAESGSYPIPDRQHARSALGFAALHHGKDSAIYRSVLAKVRAKFHAMRAAGSS